MYYFFCGLLPVLQSSQAWKLMLNSQWRYSVCLYVLHVNDCFWWTVSFFMGPVYYILLQCIWSDLRTDLMYAFSKYISDWKFRVYSFQSCILFWIEWEIVKKSAIVWCFLLWFNKQCCLLFVKIQLQHAILFVACYITPANKIVWCLLRQFNNKGCQLFVIFRYEQTLLSVGYY